VAAGHPATVEAGIEVLDAGGSAVDAAVAASLASCVAETVMTGLLGGGHAIVYAPGEEARTLDFFVAAPGLGAGGREAEPRQLEVPFGVEIVHYAIGVASCGVPGLPAGLHELWRDGGRLPWEDLVEPALRLARGGVELPAGHAACLAMLEPVMTMGAGARIYAPNGRLLGPGDRVEQPGLVPALELVAREGGRTLYEGALAEALLASMEELGGLVTRRDLEVYEPRWQRADARASMRGLVLGRAGGLNSPQPVFERLPSLAEASAGERVLALAGALDGDDRAGETTNITAVDREGNACVLTTSLGLGSGDWLPGFDLHLNSMLGEADLLVGELAPGDRMASMMAPTLILGERGLALAAGAAGGTRLRSALVQVVAGILDEGLEPSVATRRPRLHRVGDVVHVEPGLDPQALGALEREGYDVRCWEAPHHYFGGVSAVGVRGAAGDPRRSGAARTIDRNDVDQSSTFP